jgi:hypothetical protein
MFRPKLDKNHLKIESDEKLHKGDSLSEKAINENNSKKGAQPETLEEVEAREKNN